MTEQPTTAGVLTLTEQPPRGRPGREAARYRTQARDARERAGQLQQQLDERQRRAVLRALEETLAVPEDLFRLGGVTLEDLRDEDGRIDPDRVVEAASALLERKPGLGKPRGATSGTAAEGLPGAVARAIGRARRA